ncbi:peptide deformylase [Geoalkalibacter halelectricus]|uniref:Peptide deformylase n=1 Tax=Geoalkalibacter halelectricus TaxID=2847045 RepID=A0ABY5ZKJ1_9BACT|nr:peptide deformylase [Geoalkalibacter halelectricus]MDO3378025.1 peptide deformylase [Geoalkalibacter halelectricus]UWZ78325.1 peptide deformylase [Geoalkalibacter halelectricus]
MALRKILHYPEPLLREVSQPVTEFDAELRELARDMAETMYAAPGVGLAAPQVGVLKRLIVLDCSPQDEERRLIVAVNPEILSATDEINEEEGCLSVPGYYARVVRSPEVRVRFLDLEGEAVEMTAGGLLAVAFQHEIDHLNGVLFVDHLSSLKKGLFKKKYKKIMEKKQEEL